MTPEERAFVKNNKTKNIERQVVKILRAVPANEDRGVEIAVVRYYSEGRVFQPQLVFQEVYTDRLDHRRKHGKLKGLKWGDVKFITQPDVAAEILELLLDLPTREKTAQRGGQDAAANDDMKEQSPPASNPLDEEPTF